MWLLSCSRGSLPGGGSSGTGPNWDGHDAVMIDDEQVGYITVLGVWLYQ